MQAIEHHEQTEGNIDHVAVVKLSEMQSKLRSAKSRLSTAMAASEVFWNDGKQVPVALMLKIETTDKEVQELERLLPEMKLAAAPKNNVHADLMLRAIREVLTDKDASPERQQAVVRGLVQMISVGREDIKLFLIDASHSNDVLGAAVGGGLTSDPERLLDLDSNQEPSH